MVFKCFSQLSEYGIAQTNILLDNFLLSCYFAYYLLGFEADSSLDRIIRFGQWY
jgi:hypothetical protein